MMVRTCGLYKRRSYKALYQGKEEEDKKKRWEDNIREWTGLDFNSSQRAAADRQRWQKIVASVSSGAPGGSSTQVTGNLAEMAVSTKNDFADTESQS